MDEDDVFKLGEFVLKGMKFNRRIPALNVGEHLLKNRDEVLKLLGGQKLSDKRYKVTDAWLFAREND